MKKIFETGMTLFLLLFITACTPNYYYFKPEISGQIYDQKTKKPLSNRSGYIGYDLGLDEDKMVKTDSQGRFKITPKRQSYYFFRPNMKKLSMSAPQIYINFKGYRTNIYDYSNGQTESMTNSSDEKELVKINIGNIYLEPE
ncbi:hypothetical protein I6M90_16290 [Acinetobacter bereziniae]|uniref:hypothetical protein n=1 Tax=Acinetobacter bereziniae TaxID=106648 RepID=UPI0018FF6008|nr:hypothetical protein [Acinetobacter bereziniae]MBJ8453477.1 hypothetical protein [Acinetobacter bereziniae]MBJ8457617.1 hypothetical protein [Acinetobacter bereziniae]